MLLDISIYFCRLNNYSINCKINQQILYIILLLVAALANVDSPLVRDDFFPVHLSSKDNNSVQYGNSYLTKNLVQFTAAT